MPKIDNPPAFPTDGRIQHGTAYDGMSLHDWFAGQALAGLLAHASGEDPMKSPALAYVLADAMLVERVRGND